MTFARRTLCITALTVLAMVLSPASAWGQQILQDAKEATGPLNAEQTQSVRDFVEPWMGKLTGGESEDVTAARNAILREFRSTGISDSFRAALSVEVSRLMAEAIQSESDLVRINAMIIATQLTNDGAEQFIDAGLNDPNAAVQYWSAKAYLERVERAMAEGGAGMPAAEQRSVIQKVQGIFGNEPPTPVARVGIEILSGLTAVEARTATLALLHDRLDVHAAQPQMSYLAEQTAIQLLSEAISLERRSDPGQVTELARAAYRYFVQINEQMQSGNVLESAAPGHLSMMDWCNKCLQAMTGKMEAAVPPASGEVNDQIRLGRWGDLAEMAQTWHAVLTAPPFSVSADELE